MYLRAPTKAPGHKSKETVTLSITLNPWGLGRSDMQSCHPQRGIGGCFLDPRPPAFLFNLWRKPQHHNKHKSTLNLFCLTSEQVLPNGFPCITVLMHMYKCVWCVTYMCFLNPICIPLLQGK